MHKTLRKAHADTDEEAQAAGCVVAKASDVRSLTVLSLSIPHAIAPHRLPERKILDHLSWNINVGPSQVPREENIHALCTDRQRRT